MSRLFFADLGWSLKIGGIGKEFSPQHLLQTKGAPRTLCLFTFHLESFDLVDHGSACLKIVSSSLSKPTPTKSAMNHFIHHINNYSPSLAHRPWPPNNKNGDEKTRISWYITVWPQSQKSRW